jgi:hypothetical protein
MRNGKRRLKNGWPSAVRFGNKSGLFPSSALSTLPPEQKKRSGGEQNRFDVAVSAALKQQLAKKGIK